MTADALAFEQERPEFMPAGHGHGALYWKSARASERVRDGKTTSCKFMIISLPIIQYPRSDPSRALT